MLMILIAIAWIIYTQCSIININGNLTIEVAQNQTVGNPTEDEHAKYYPGKSMSSSRDLNSFKIYHENESVFNQITITENNEAMKKLQKTAEENAVANGLLENARDNSETILKIFFSNKYDLEKYEIVFKDK